MNIFITGTDTDVGKTVVTAGIAAVLQNSGYSVGVYKPAQSGCLSENGKLILPDPHFVESINSNIVTKTTYNLIHPTAPAIAAQIEGVKIEPKNFLDDYKELSKECDIVLVEGAGGLLVPVYENFLMRDLIKLLDLPLIIVARPDLGTINHTLLTIEAAKNRNIEVLGVIISNYPEDTEDVAITTAPKLIQELSGEKILGILPKIQAPDQITKHPETLTDKVIEHINLKEIFKVEF